MSAFDHESSSFEAQMDNGDLKMLFDVERKENVPAGYVGKTTERARNRALNRKLDFIFFQRLLFFTSSMV